MKPSPAAIDVDAGLAEVLETRVRILLNKLVEQYSTDEIQAELTNLIQLIDEFKLRDELLEKLLNPVATSTEARLIADQLPEQYKQAAEQGADLQNLHSRSHQLLQQSAVLITRAQRRLDQSDHPNSHYALEVCGRCRGLGGSQGTPCPGCKGKRTVLVYQPPIGCPRCKGSGRPDRRDPSTQCYGICVVCCGSGWALTLREGQARS